MTFLMLRTVPRHNDLLLPARKLMGRILRMLVPIVAADQSDYTPVQNKKPSTVNYEALKALDVGVKV